MKLDKDTSILILSHGYRKSNSIGGPPQDIRDYFLNKIEKINYIVNPFPHANFKESLLYQYRNGKLENTPQRARNTGPEWLMYIQQVFYTIYFLLRNPEKYDICFALDNLSLLSVLTFKKIGIIKKLVYYSIDYSPNRFTNKILNSIYQTADRVACSQSDTNWVVARHMVNARRDNGVDLKKSSPFLEVPMGFRGNRIKIQPISKIDRFHLVYVGIIFRKQGIQLLIKALSIIIRKFPKTHLTIIGTGNYERELKTLVKNLKLQKAVTFKGFIKNHENIEKILTKAGIGAAPYKPTQESFTYYADPGKIKLYLGCGLPIITTSVPAISKELSRRKAGVVSQYTKGSFIKSLEKLLNNKSDYEIYRKNAIRLSKSYDTEKILGKAIKSLQ